MWDAGPASIALGLLLAITATVAFAIIIWLFYALVKSLFE
jgi:hypothetical protein